MKKRITVTIADITKQPVDAIVNAANREMLGGGGVDGAIHNAAGPQLVAECATYPADANGYRLQTGDAKITKGYNLPAKYVIHTVGPDCRTHEFASNPVTRDAALASSYRRSLEVAKENGCKSVAFPAISIGIYKFPLERAAQIAAEVIGDFLAQEKDMSVCLCILVPGNPTEEANILSAYEKAFAAKSKTQVRKTRGAVSSASSTGNDFIANCAESVRNLESLHSPYLSMRGILKSLGDVYGVKCVEAGDSDWDWSPEKKLGKFELHTSRGEFKIRPDCFGELGLFTLELQEGLEVRYTDIRLVVAMGLLSLGRYDTKSGEYKFGDERDGCFKTNLPLATGDWVELRGMSEEWAWDVARRMGFPSCLDRFEHFCRHIAWIGEDGRLIVNPNEIISCNWFLLKLEDCCQTRWHDVSSIVSDHFQKNLLAIKDLLKNAD